MGKVLSVISEQLKIPPMEKRGYPPLLILISDGKTTDDYNKGLEELIDQPLGKKSVRIAITIGDDVDHEILQKFIGNNELKPLNLENAEDFIKYCFE